MDGIFRKNKGIETVALIDWVLVVCFKFIESNDLEIK